MRRGKKNNRKLLLTNFVFPSLFFFWVSTDTLTDQEARKRATSVYMADRRYDMLPHVLSGNLCSLLGQVDRYAVSVFWELDAKANVVKTWFGRTVIRSAYKVGNLCNCFAANEDKTLYFCDCDFYLILFSFVQAHFF